MRYMLLVYDCLRQPEGSAEADQKIAAVRAFIEMCEERGVLEAYDPLLTDDTAVTVRVRDGETLFTDGPYAETREQLGGYFVLNCDRDEVLELAAVCPFAAEGGLEIRPIMTVPGIGRSGSAAPGAYAGDR